MSERTPAFRPVEKAIDFRLPRAGGQHAVSRQHDPELIVLRELGHRLLPFEDLPARRRMEQPGGQRRPASRRGGGTQPLKERRASEEIEIERERMLFACELRRDVTLRQQIPVARDARQRARVDEAQRIVPRDALLDPRLPEHAHAEGGVESRGGHERRRGRAAPERPDRDRGREEKRHEPEAGYPLRHAAFRLACVPVALRVVRVGDRFAAHHAARSTPAGLRAWMFRRQ